MKDSCHKTGPIIVEEVVRGIPATQLLSIIIQLVKFAGSEVSDTPIALWDVVFDADESGIALYAYAPDLQDPDSEYVAFWHFGKAAWVWEIDEQLSTSTKD